MKNKISIWREKIPLKNDLKDFRCDYVDKKGNKCKEWATWLHQNNRKYCELDHVRVNEINKKREKEFIAEFKENIIKELNLIKCRIISHPLNIIKECEHEQCQEIEELIDRLKLNNGDFDE